MKLQLTLSVCAGEVQLYCTRKYSQRDVEFDLWSQYDNIRLSTLLPMGKGNSWQFTPFQLTAPQ